MNIVFASHSPIREDIVVGSHHLARCYARSGHNVIHISAPVTLANALRRNQTDRLRLRLAHGAGMKIEERLWEIVPKVILPWQIMRRFPRGLLFRWTRTRWLSLVAGILNGKVDALFIDDPRFVGLERGLRPGALVYRATDDYSAMLSGGPAVSWCERRLCLAADVLVATSTVVASRLSKLSAGRPVAVIENGVDAAHFRRPGRLSVGRRHAEKRCAVYIGAVDHRLDFDVLYALGRQFVDWEFLLAGPIMTSLGQKILALPNVRFLGPVPYEQAPTLLHRCEIGLLPFSQHPGNDGRSPMKYYEYLAAGLKIVGKVTREMGRRRCSAAFLYRNTQEAIARFSDAADSSVGLNELEALAAAFDWRTRADELYSLAVKAVRNGG